MRKSTSKDASLNYPLSCSNLAFSAKSSSFPMDQPIALSIDLGLVPNRLFASSNCRKTLERPPH